MELEKQKNISRVIHNTLKRFEDFPKDSFEIKSIDLKYVLEYTVFLEKELDRLQKENDLAKKALIANSYEADERNNLLVKIQELQKENEEFRKLEKDHNYSVPVIRENSKLRYELAHSVSCDKIRENIDNRISIVEKMLDEMIDKSIGCINVSLLNKKEKEEVINKRNCLIVQKATLEDIKKDLLEEE